ncbi:MAG TPA: hypothetical protein VLD37_06280 [Candidatus Bilamarchaeum sp.]|nr:hypothetical protein [Candidatus Bilamarchaeum sp.]
MKLLIDYLEESAGYLRERKEKLKKLEDQFKRIYDRDIKKEMVEIKREISRKNLEVITELLFNLDEFRALHKYFPELLSVYMEDEYIGKVLTKKAWLLDFRQLPPAEAAAKLGQIKSWRAQLRDAKNFLRSWSGTVDAKSFVATYPILRGHMSGEMFKDDAVAAIANADKLLLREGWLLLISDSLIHIPLAKYVSQIQRLRYDEMSAMTEFNRSKGRGTVAETAALRKLQKIKRKKSHNETAVIQILLSNPEYLKALKKKKDWLSRDKSGTLEQIAKSVTPHTIKERVWLDEMNKKISGEAGGKDAPAAPGPAAKAPKPKTKRKRKDAPPA